MQNASPIFFSKYIRYEKGKKSLNYVYIVIELPQSWTTLDIKEHLNYEDFCKNSAKRQHDPNFQQPAGS